MNKPPVGPGQQPKTPMWAAPSTLRWVADLVLFDVRWCDFFLRGLFPGASPARDVILSRQRAAKRIARNLRARATRLEKSKAQRKAIRSMLSCPHAG